jgi:2-hydroxyglutarate dehydrogenase
MLSTMLKFLEHKESLGLRSRALFYNVFRTSRQYSSSGISVQERRRGKFPSRTQHILGVMNFAITHTTAPEIPKSFMLVRKSPQIPSSRQVSHLSAGLYYPPNSLKTRLCLRGRQMLYSYCAKHSIPHQRLGKLIVGREAQREYLAKMHAKAQALRAPPHWDRSADPQVLPTEILSGDAARKRVPALAREITSALWSPSTGIVDSATLLNSLERDIRDAGGTIAYATRAVRIDIDATADTERSCGGPGWVVQTVTGTEENDGDAGADATLARVLVNAAGLGATSVLNEILPPARRVPIYFARGAYATYRGPGVRDIQHLVYPADEASAAKGASFHSLGTHLTLDMAGNVRFGPDIDWLSAPNSAKHDEEVWEPHLSPDEERARSMHASVLRYLPGVKPEGFQPDYAGIRPKLAPPGAPFQDFIVRTDYAEESKGRAPMISLLGIESPGLTASLALAEMVVDDMLAKTNEKRIETEII